MYNFEVNTFNKKNIYCFKFLYEFSYGNSRNHTEKNAYDR